MPSDDDTTLDLASLASALTAGQSSSHARRRYLGVADGIMAAIGTGQLSPGDRLPNERLLAEILHTSRTSVRDALLVLEVSGVVEVRRGSGCYVSDLRSPKRRSAGVSLDSVPRELLQARIVVEPAVAAASTEYLEPRDIVDLRALIDECEAEGTPDDLDDLSRWLELSHRFHSVLADKCGNRILTDFAMQIVDVSVHPLWQVVNMLYVRDPRVRAAQVAEHRQILDAIARGDGAGAAAAMAHHLTELEVNIFGARGLQTGIRRQPPRTR